MLLVLAIPSKSSVSASQLIASASCKLVQAWNCRYSMVGMVFDTNGNTGCQIAAWGAVQTKLDKTLLWLACRHHISDVFFTIVWNALGTSQSPDITFFHRFKNHFLLLAYDLNNLNFTDFLGSSLERKADIVNMCKNFFSNNRQGAWVIGTFMPYKRWSCIQFFIIQ